MTRGKPKIENNKKYSSLLNYIIKNKNGVRTKTLAIKFYKTNQGTLTGSEMRGTERILRNLKKQKLIFVTKRIEHGEKVYLFDSIGYSMNLVNQKIMPYLRNSGGVIFGDLLRYNAANIASRDKLKNNHFVVKIQSILELENILAKYSINESFDIVFNQLILKSIKNIHVESKKNTITVKQSTNKIENYYAGILLNTLFSGYLNKILGDD